MQSRSTVLVLESEASAQMEQSIRHAFCTALHVSGLQPMAVLQRAAQALGAIYREAAAAHRGPGGCPCGWHPDAMVDLEALQHALAAAAAEGRIDLRHAVPIGRG